MYLNLKYVIYILKTPQAFFPIMSATLISLAKGNTPAKYIFGGQTTYKNVQQSTGLITDIFGRIKTSNPKTLYNSCMLYDLDPLRWRDSITGGTITGPSNGVATLTATNAASRVFRQSDFYLPYLPGRTVLIRMTGVLVGTVTTTCATYIGSYDSAADKTSSAPDSAESNGHFFTAQTAASVTTIYVGMRSSVSGSQVDTLIAQANWNLDKLDGTGNSGITIDFTKTNIFVIEKSWYGSTRMGISIAGSIVWCHQFIFEGTTQGVFLVKANLPLRYEITNGSAGSATLLQICCDVTHEGNIYEELKSIPFSIGTGGSGIAISTVNTNDNFKILLRLTSARPRTFIKLNSIIIASTTSAATILAIKLVMNPQVNANTGWVAITNSAIEYNVNGFNNTGTNSNGTLVKSATSSASGDLTVMKDLQNVILGSSVAGTGATNDWLGISVFRLTGANCSAAITINWEEFY